ncbi:MAG: addiction module protein [Myxococcota bacterium]
MLADALALPDAERRDVAQRLLASLEPAVELSKEWTDAVRNRLEELEAGNVKAVP